MKTRRPVIGIPFNYDDGWIGGVYYIKNLISALNLLGADEKPEIWMLSNKRESFDFIRKSTGYPHLNWLPPALLTGIDGGISRKVRLLSRLAPWFVKKQVRFDMIFPYPIDTKLQQTVCWIPDFQDKRMPDFFKAEELEARTRQHRDYIENYRHLVLSSEAARQDFEEFYPDAKVNRYVVHFAVFEPREAAVSEQAVLEKYALPGRFFYCPNQFWIHKNHDLVIRAVSLLKQRGVDVTVVFSGKEHDPRAPEHTSRLKAKVAAEGLESNVRFLGFIPREDQMVVFRKAISIIQPSLFEGWSTVIEDAKSVSQYVLASRIPANVEQANRNIEFFDPFKAEELAHRMEQYAQTDPVRETIDYTVYQKEFAEAFINVIRSVMRANSLAAGELDK